MLKMLEKYCCDIATWYEPVGGFYIWLHMNVPFQTVAYLTKL